jgi:hypothetical protein
VPPRASSTRSRNAKAPTRLMRWPRRREAGWRWSIGTRRCGGRIAPRLPPLGGARRTTRGRPGPRASGAGPSRCAAGHGHGRPTRPAAKFEQPDHRPSRAADRAGKGGLDRLRVPQDPPRPWLPLPTPRCRRLPLREHLRDLRQLRARPRTPTVLRDQLADIRQLRADAQQPGWTGEVQRTAASSTRWKPTATGWKTDLLQQLHLDKITIAG